MFLIDCICKHLGVGDNSGGWGVGWGLSDVSSGYKVILPQEMLKN